MNHIQSPEHEFNSFFYLTKRILRDLEHLEKDLQKTLKGNSMAARRARVALLDLQKDGKIFRKLSIKHAKRNNFKRNVDS